MKIILTVLLLFAIFLLGCTDTPIFPVKNNNDHSYQLIKLPKKFGMSVENIFSVTKEIDGTHGGQIILDESYVTADLRNVYIYAKLKIHKNSFEDTVDITLTINDDVAVIDFSPPMIFNNPLELSLTFEGLDLEGLNLTTGDFDFVFIDEEGNIEVIGYNAIHVNEAQGKIWVTKADLPYFSRYGFIH